MADVFIFDALRTPRGRGKAGKGGLANHHPQELLAQTLNHMAERKKLDKSLVEDVAIGCVTQVKEQGACIARIALIAARLARGRHRLHDQPLLRLGPRGGQLIAAMIGAGFIDGGIGGGVESMSRVPMGSRRRDARRPQREAAQAPVHGAAGHLGRPDRDARGLHPRRRRPVRARRASRRRRARSRSKRFANAHVRGARTTTARSRSIATSTRAPTPRSRRSAASSRRSRRWARRRWARTARRSISSRC